MGKANLTSINTTKEFTRDDASDYPIVQSSTPHRLEFWPTTPVPIVRGPVVEHSLDVFDVGLCLIPLALIAKTCLCIYAWSIDRANQGEYIDQVSLLTIFLVQFNEQLTTVFTIVFILIMTIAVRRIALWRAERGATVAELELFQASTSLPATVRVIFALRLLSWTTAFLLFVWCFYYLGSQASSREYAYRDSGVYSDLNVAYLATSAKSPFQDGIYEQMSTIQRTDMTAKFHIYSATDISTKGYDLEGAVLVPIYSFSGDSSAAQDVTGWRDVSKSSSNHYSSSIGANLYYQKPSMTSPISNTSDVFYNDKVVGDYVFDTSYLAVNCSTPALLDTQSAPVGLLETMTMSFNMTNTNASVSGGTSSPPRQFEIWGALDNYHSLQSTCIITRQFVEVQVRCDANGCKARKMRPSQGTQLVSNRTPFDNSELAETFFSTLLLACGVPPSTNETTDILVEQDSGWATLRSKVATALLTGSSSSLADSSAMGNVLSSETATNLSLAMTKIINTWNTASQFLPYQHTFEQSLRQTASVSISPDDSSFAHVNMYGAPYYPQYALSIPWIVMDLLSCKILLAAAVMAFWLRKRTLAPDIFGYVSSLTRDNPGMAMPEGGSTLSGLERARAMKNVKVRIGDVGGSARGVGRVGLTYVGNEDVKMTKLKKGTNYF